MRVKHHYGWVDIGKQEPYKHIRETHDFLTDENHRWEDTGHSIIIFRNENSPEYHRLTPEWAKTDYWFSMEYEVDGCETTFECSMSPECPCDDCQKENIKMD